MTAAAVRNQTALRRLAGGLSFVCLVLMLLAVEQPQAVAAWQAVRDAASRVAGLEADAPAALTPSAVGPGVGLAGEYRPADEATRAATGALAFIAADLQFESGERLRTRPLRIASGDDSFAVGQTFAARLAAPADAQVELRQVIPAAAARSVRPSPLCGGLPPRVAALLHRGERVDLMLFHAAPGPDAPPAALCGVWSFTAR